jgi:hypothetical protein
MHDAEVARQQHFLAQQMHDAEVARQQHFLAQQMHDAEVARQQHFLAQQMHDAEVARQARVSAAAAPGPVNRFAREAPARTYEKPEATKSKKFVPREFLCKYFQRHSIPEALGLSITIALAALLSSALFSSYLAVLVVCFSLHLLQEEYEGLSLGRCFCLSLLPFALRAVIEFVSGSEITGLAIFCIMMYPSQPHPAIKTL